jgi:hypothetical protein
MVRSPGTLSYLISHMGVDIGTSIQLFGNITTGMGYVIEMDGSSSDANPTNQILASVSGLELGNHVLNITAHNPAPGSTLFFEGATVTVGTGLKG